MLKPIQLSDIAREIVDSLNSYWNQRCKDCDIQDLFEYLNDLENVEKLLVQEHRYIEGFISGLINS